MSATLVDHETRYRLDLIDLVAGFEYEKCEECGEDVSRHIFRPDPLGLPHAYCSRSTVGTCPACGEDVYDNEPDGPVWTCPADLADTNRYAEPCLYPELLDKWESDGYYGRCGEDVGLSCHDPLPLHSACYEKGDY